MPSWGKGGVDRVRLFLLPTSACPNSCFFLQWCARTSPLKTWTSSKSLSSMGHWLRLFSRGLCGQELLKLDYMSLQGPQPRSRSVCLLSNTWVDETPSGSHMVLGPTAPTKKLFSKDRLQIIVGDKHKGCLILP